MAATAHDHPPADLIRVVADPGAEVSDTLY